MKLSIIIPTLNEEKYLFGLLEIIKLQSFTDYELIVADANSGDATRAIARHFEARVVDGGLPAVSRNKGAAIARGDIFLFLDADVLLPHPEYLANIVAEFEKKDLGIASCLPVPISVKKIDVILHSLYNLWVRLIKRLLPHAAGLCIMARRNVHERINGFNEAICLAEDHDYAKRAVRFGKFGILKEKILVSVRRMERDGRLNVALKYVACEFYLMAGGQSKIKYDFGYDEK